MSPPPIGAPAQAGTPSLSAGYLAALPLFAAYELGLRLAGSAERAAAERVVARILFLFGGGAQAARVALLVALAGFAWVRLRNTRAEAAGTPRGLGRLVLAGLCAGVLLGPLLVLLQAWLGAGPLAPASEPARTLPAVLVLVGAAPWEELLFRVGLYGGIFLAVRRAVAFLGLASHAARAGAELAALLGSAVIFAWFHLDGAQALLGARGEPFHRGAFLWRVSAGILLGGLFRWRGFGVAAWAHAVFNLGVALGVRA